MSSSRVLAGILHGIHPLRRLSPHKTDEDLSEAKPRGALNETPIDHLNSNAKKALKKA